VKKLFYILAVLLVTCRIAYSQKTIQAIRVEKAPVIDGYVNEEIWKSAFPVTEFYQREPNNGQPVSQKTEFLVCYDANNLYFGIRCWDDPKRITAKEMARDVSLGNDDRIQIIIDTYLNKRSGYWFQIGPRGSIGDAIVSENGGTLNKDWDGLWDGKAHINDWGWEAEMIIPFKTMGFDKNIKQWGIKFIRNMVSRLEQAYWPSANINNLKFQISDAGILDGMENINQGIGLDVSPYLVTGFDTKRGVKADPKLTGGVDVFYQITPSLKSSLTIHTDFAETEVDDRQINLTRFNLFFPEKRDFFLDGANYFQFGIEGDQESPVAKRIIPFFSRRIGLDSQNNPISVNYGGKLTGQVGNWNIGMMYINDEHETGHHFSVARVSGNIGKQSSVGVIGTSGNALNAATNYVTGFDVKLSTSTYRGNKNASLFLFGLKSVTEKVSGKDASWGVQALYPNDLVYARLGYHEIGKNFIAGTGFVPRTNIRESYGQFRIGPRPKKWGIMQFQAGVDVDFIHNLETHDLENRDIRLKPLGFRFMSGEEVSYSIINQFERLPNDFKIYQSVIIPKGSYTWWRNSVQYKTKGARKIWSEGSYSFGHFYEGSRREFITKVNLKIAVPFFLGGGFNLNKVHLPQGQFTTSIYQLNTNFLFSPKVTLYNYMQYDNASKTLGCQSRFQWILKPGKEIMLVWTAGFLRPDGDLLMDNSATRLKIKYNIRF
jgi:hypothetical protein